jgi:hypothetical protein
LFSAARRGLRKKTTPERFYTDVVLRDVSAAAPLKNKNESGMRGFYKQVTPNGVNQNRKEHIAFRSPLTGHP